MEYFDYILLFVYAVIIIAIVAYAVFTFFVTRCPICGNRKDYKLLRSDEQGDVYIYVRIAKQNFND